MNKIQCMLNYVLFILLNFLLEMLFYFLSFIGNLKKWEFEKIYQTFSFPCF